MRIIDYEYIAQNISSISRIPIRVYKNGNTVYFADPVKFFKDPAADYIDTLLSIKLPVSYYISPFEHFYGVISFNEYQLIIGPTLQIVPTRDKIRDFMFSLGVTENYMEEYRKILSMMTPIPFEIFLRELCLIYYFISEEKMDISEVIIFDSSQNVIRQGKSAANVPDIYETEAREIGHNTLSFESDMLSYIEKGNVNALKKMFSSLSAGHAGKLATTYLRQTKNIFITTATLASRAAIAGGMPAEDALTLSDHYIQHAENHNEPEQILNLQYNMILDYASTVNSITKGRSFDRMIRKTIDYVQTHLTDEGLSVTSVAGELDISRSHLSSKFKSDTGMSLNDYINEQRINKAKDLLTQTERSILEISTFLGFSSQGYFQNVFKKYVGMTPRQYRLR